jgi:outer membrane protein insertion porin family
VTTTTSESYEYVGGEKEAYFNFEYLFPIAKDAGLKGVLFFDTGNAWLKDEDFFESMRYSIGGGIRWLSPLGPLRLEWGRNLDPLQDERKTEVEFSIGRFF